MDQASNRSSSNLLTPLVTRRSRFSSLRRYAFMPPSGNSTLNEEAEMETNGQTANSQMNTGLNKGKLVSTKTTHSSPNRAYLRPGNGVCSFSAGKVYNMARVLDANRIEKLKLIVQEFEMVCVLKS
ncbi:unnamed protein product [Protopolystoma xenopodis]|uniref:Uncharacterized protein n=1 Tax=Protopolystoma xenopodis TaxID=117903 RepID=A0A448XEV0_9PLAT|nr:unnamed protein product [Protopolystoma xenopodis]